MIPYPRLETGERIVPIKVSVNQNIVPLSTASIQMRSDQLIPQRAYVEMFTPIGSAGWFRARLPEDNYVSKITTVSMDHAICEVGDYLVRTKIDQTQESLNDALERVWEYYDGSRWQLGTVSVEANVVYSADYANLLSTINSLIAQIPSAMMTFDFSTSPWTFNVVSRGSTVVAEGRLGRNISSAKVSRDDSNLCTRVWLKGLGQNMSVGSMDADTISTYGVIERRLQDNDYTRNQAQTVATNYLAKHKNPKYAISINGIELSQITGETLDKAEIGALYRLVIPGGTPIEQNVITLNWPDVYSNPKAVTITLAEEEYTQTQFMKAQQIAIDTAHTPTQVNTLSKNTRIEQSDDHLAHVAESTAGGQGKTEVRAESVESALTSGQSVGKIRFSEGVDGILVEIEGYDITIVGQNSVSVSSENISISASNDVTISGETIHLIGDISESQPIH